MSIRVTVDQLAVLYRAAFDQVCNPADWKAPVDAIVPWELANLYMQAIEFMTGVRPEFVRLYNNPDMARLTCCGYRNGPCGG